MNHLVPMLILLAGPSFTSPDPAQRRRAAEAWSQRKGMALSARALGGLQKLKDPCVRLRAPAPAGCAEGLELCAWSSSGGSCSGSWAQTQGVQQVDGGASFELVDRSGWEPDAFECERANPEFAHLVDGGRVRLPERARRRDVEQCLREARAEASREETSMACDVMAVNPCLKEAYLTCRGQLNGARVTRTTWVSWADGGEPAWERYLTDVEDVPAEDGGG
jgi:hypothetical protein